MLRNEGLDAHSIRLEVTDTASVRDATLIGADYGRLDIQVNNAGIIDSKDGPPTSGSVDAARRLLETNFLGASTAGRTRLSLIHVGYRERCLMLEITGAISRPTSSRLSMTGKVRGR